MYSVACVEIGWLDFLNRNNKSVLYFNFNFNCKYFIILALSKYLLLLIIILINTIVIKN